MDSPPREPEAFTERVARLMIEHLGRAEIAITGPLELTIDDRLVGLDNLYRAMHQGEEEPRAVFERFIHAYLSARQLEEVPLPFEVARHKILPRIHPLEFFRDRQPDFFAYQPFVNDTVILYMIDLRGAVTPVTTEQLIRWGIGVEEIDQLARENLAVHRPELELKVFHGESGAAALFNTGDGYDAARILLSGLHPNLSPELGGDFLVAIPTRDVFVAFPTEPDGFVGRLKKRIEHDFKKLPYPITDDLFLVTLDGVADWRPAA